MNLYLFTRTAITKHSLFGLRMKEGILTIFQIPFTPPDGEENAPSGKMARLWRTGALGEYKAIYAAPSEKMAAFLKKKCFKNLDIAKEQYEPKEGIFTLGIEPEPIPFEKLPYTDISQVTKKARTLAKKHLTRIIHKFCKIIFLAPLLWERGWGEVKAKSLI